MARKADIQYIRSGYTDGTAARKLVFNHNHPKAPLPLFEPETVQQDQKISVSVDPLAVTAIVVAVVLVAMMVVGLIYYGHIYHENVALQEYIYFLRNENIKLAQTYRGGYDLAQIEAQAMALGMVPADQLQTLTISGRVPVEAPAPTFWENVQQVFAELFANAKV